MATEAAGLPDPAPHAPPHALPYASGAAFRPVDALGAGAPDAGSRTDPGPAGRADADDRLRTMLDAIPTPVWSARPDGSLEFLNRGCLDGLGLSSEEAQRYGWAAAVHPDDRAAFEDYWRGVLALGEPGEVEVRLRMADRAYRRFLVRCSSVHDAAGAVVRWLGANTDIEDRCQAEDALRASEHNLRSLLDSLPGLAIVMDGHGEVELVNRPMLAYCGKALEELRRWTTSDAVHPDDVQSVIATWQGCVDTGEPGESTFRLRRADGAYRWFRGRSEPLRDGAGRVVRWSTLLTDVEAMQRVTDALQESEQRLRQTIDGIPGFVYTMAPDGEPEFFNRPILEYYGRTAEELMHWAQTDAIHQGDLARAVGVWSRAVETGRDYSLELRLRRADGVYRWFELRSRTVHDADGRIVRSYGLCTDIHDRKRAERRLRRAMRARYEAALAERTRIAREMHDGLLQDITGIALQLRAVLPHILASPEVAAERLGRILDSVRRANRAARDAVAGMRVRADAVDLVGAVQDEAQRLTTRAGLALSVSVSGPVRFVGAAVRDAAVSVVHEALTNIVKHTRASRARVSVRFGAARLRVSVGDDGGGLTPPGDGGAAAGHFGLTGMRERAASIGASLQVSNVPHRGATVRLDAPLPDTSD